MKFIKLDRKPIFCLQTTQKYSTSLCVMSVRSLLQSVTIIKALTYDVFGFHLILQNEALSITNQIPFQAALFKYLVFVSCTSDFFPSLFFIKANSYAHQANFHICLSTSLNFVYFIFNLSKYCMEIWMTV